MAEKFSFDQFDQMAQNHSRAGAHRVQKKSHKWIIALVLVVVLSPLVGIGIGTLMSMMRTGAAPAAQTAQSTGAVQGTSGQTNSATQGKKAPDSAASANDNQAGAGAAAPAAVNLGAKISVLNGTGKDGLAARNAEKLTAAGFTSVTTGDYRETDPEQSAIYYHSSELKATAQKVAAEIGITALQEDAAKAHDAAGIVVVLR